VHWWAYVVGYGVVGILAHVATNRLWRVMAVPAAMPDPGWKLLQPLPPVIGIAERVGYTAALLTGQGAFVGVWLAIKTLGVASWQHGNPEGRYPYQRNLVVTLVSLGWGAVGAQVIRWIRTDPAQWLDSTVLIAAAAVACAVLWLHLSRAVPAAVTEYETAQSDAGRA
jgi:hypothetical protein